MLDAADPDANLYPLLNYLSEAQPRAAECWTKWRIQPVTTGMNNRVYRATSDAADLAIKFTIADARQRALREYRALELVAAERPGLAPAPLLLDAERFAYPVVVASWLGGAPLEAPPADAAAWITLLEHYVAIHTIPVDETELPPAVLTMSSAAEGQRIVAEAFAQLPDEAVSREVHELVAQLAESTFPAWEPSPLALCRCDGNFRNFIVGTPGWASVDWEYSGLGDPAFEIAELVTHVSMQPTALERMGWMIEQYAVLRGETQIAVRARAYLRIMLVWWVVRLARLLYEGRCGLGVRLAPRSPRWEREATENYARYIGLGRRALDEGWLGGKGN